MSNAKPDETWEVTGRGFSEPRRPNDCWCTQGRKDGGSLNASASDASHAHRRAQQMKDEGYEPIMLTFLPPHGFEQEFTYGSPTMRDVFTLAMHEDAPHLFVHEVAAYLGADLATIRSLTDDLIECGILDVHERGTQTEEWNLTQHFPTLNAFLGLLARPHIDFDLSHVLPLAKP